jgi:hypothetical protein
VLLLLVAILKQLKIIVISFFSMGRSIFEGLPFFAIL